MFKVPLVVIQIDERQRQGEHILMLTLNEINEDQRINIGEISITLKVRPEESTDPEQGFDRKRFKPGDVWYLAMREEKKTQVITEPPAATE